MFDIGFNLGVTSLYWARNEQIKKIYGFEPFKPTRERAAINLKNNPELAKKIELFDFGFSDTDRELEFHYNPKAPENMSSTFDRYNAKDGKLEKICLKEVSKVLSPLFEKHSEKKFLKIDCEGSEKDIMPDLDKSGLLKEVSVIILEWHNEKPNYLIDILAKNGFNIHLNNTNRPVLGIIVAFKK